MQFGRVSRSLHLLCCALISLEVCCWPAQGQATAPDLSAAFISPTAYSNAALGFSFGLPKGCETNKLAISHQGGVVYSCQVQTRNLSLLIVRVLPGIAEGGKSAETSLGGDAKDKAHKTSLNGHDAWESTDTKRGSGGTMRNLGFGTDIGSKVIEITLMSFDKGFFNQERSRIEAMSFFEPQQAEAMAGPGAQPFSAVRKTGAASPERSVSEPGGLAKLAPGNLSGSTYRNDELGLTMAIPHGWQAVSAEEQNAIVDTGHRAAYGDDPDKDAEHQAVMSCSKTLLWVKEPVPESRASSLVLRAFDASCMPGAVFPSSLHDENAIASIEQQLKQLVNAMPSGTTAEITGSHARDLEGHVLIEMDYKMSARGNDALLGAFRIARSKGTVLVWMLMAHDTDALNHLKAEDVRFDPFGASSK
jgi:hypothetical protein